MLANFSMIYMYVWIQSMALETQKLLTFNPVNFLIFEQVAAFHAFVIR